MQSLGGEDVRIEVERCLARERAGGPGVDMLSDRRAHTGQRPGLYERVVANHDDVLDRRRQLRPGGGYGGDPGILLALPGACSATNPGWADVKTVLISGCRSNT